MRRISERSTEILIIAGMIVWMLLVIAVEWKD